MQARASETGAHTTSAEAVKLEAYIQRALRGAAAHSSEVIALPIIPTGEGYRCQRGPTRERVLRCGGALERGDGAALQPLAQLGDALGGVGAVAIVVEAAEPAEGQAASKGEG